MKVHKNRGTGISGVNQLPQQGLRNHSRSIGLREQKKNERRQARLAALTVALSAGAGTTLPAHAAPLAPCYTDPGVYILIPGGCIGYGGFALIADPNGGGWSKVFNLDSPSLFAPGAADPTPRVRTRSSGAFAPSSTGPQGNESDLNTPAVQRMWAEQRAMANGQSPEAFNLAWALNQPGETVSFDPGTDSSFNDNSSGGTTDWPSAPPDPVYPSPDAIANYANYTSGDSNSVDTPNVGEPINSATGNLHDLQRDYIGLGPFPIRLMRFYNSVVSVTSIGTTEFGEGWRGSYDSSVTLASGQSVPTAVVVRPDGQSLAFTNPSGPQWVATDPTVRGALKSQTDNAGNLLGWTYVTADDITETYNAAGQLLSIANRAGLTQTLAYGANGQLASVTDPFGRQLLFNYNAAGQLIQATDPAGGVYQYAYDGNNNLVSVTYPDQTTRQYAYENGALPNALTGIIDENGSRFVTFLYDSTGRASGSVLAGSVQPVSIAYSSGGLSTVTDARGTVRQHTFMVTTSGAMKPSTNAVLSCTVATCPLIGTGITYDANGFPTSGVDPNGNALLVTYNARGLLASRTEAAGTALARTTTITWHPVFHLPTLISFPDRSLSFTYDGAGNRTSKSIIAGGVSRTWTYAYNSQGLLTQMTGPRTDLSQMWKFAYDNQGHLISMSDPLGHTMRFLSYDAYGHVLTMTDPNGLTGTFTYDARGRLIRSVVGTKTLALQRDAVGQIIRMTYPNGSIVSLTYDAAHRLTDRTDSSGAHLHRTLTAAGDVPQLQLFDAGGALIRQQSFAVDGLGRIVSSTDANGQTMNIGYDNSGHATTSVDALGRTKSVAYDALNRLVSTTDALGNLTTVQLNAYDQPLKITAPNGAVTQYSYDSFGMLTQGNSSDRGVNSIVYTPWGLPLSRTDARGVTTSFTFDALNRVIQIAYSNPAAPASPPWLQALGSAFLTDNVSLTYDQGTGCTNGIGRLCTRQDQSGTERYSYDVFGDVTQQFHAILGFSYSTQYAYDTVGQLTQMTYPDGRVISYARDALERLTGVQSTVNRMNTAILSGAQYRADGAPSSLTLGNGIVESRGYDPVGRLVSQIVGSVDSRAYGFDAVGNVTSKQTSAETDQFTYDSLNHLIGEGRVQAAVVHNNGFGYDANGNRLSEVRDGVTTTLQYTAASNRLVNIGASALTLDAAGNTISDNGGARKFYYSAAGRLQWLSQNGVPVAAYFYNWAGQRTGKITLQGISLYHYDILGRLLSETTVGAQPSRDYLWADNMPIAQIDHWVPIGNMLQLENCHVGADGKIDWVTYLHTDGLGTPRTGTDVARNVVWRWDGEAFGETAPTQAVPSGAYPVIVNLRNPGQYADQETGLFYNKARFYNPQTGRYISSDPIGLHGGLNTYAYALGNPLATFDSLGLQPPIPGNLTPEQIQRANDDWDQFVEDQNRVAIDQKNFDLNPTNQNGRVLAEDKATSTRALERWYADIGLPDTSDLPSADNGQEPPVDTGQSTYNP